MGNFVYSLIIVLLLVSTVEAATVVGQPRFSTYSAHVQLQLDGLKNSGTRGFDGRNGFDGRPGVPALFCNISSGTRSIVYDKAGINPLPAITPYHYILQAGSSIVSALRLVWRTGVGVLSGTGSGSSFTPSVSASNVFGNNYVQVQMTYSSGTLTGGKRFCVTSVPISVTQIGESGAKGDPGQSVSVTEPTVINAFNTSASNSKLVLQASTGVQTKLDIKDATANTKYYVDSNGTWGSAGGTINGQLVAISAVPLLTTAAAVTGSYGLTLTSSTAYLLTLTGNTIFTISTPPRAQESFTAMLIQGGIGGYTATWPAAVSWGTVGAPTLSTTAGKWDIVSCMTANSGGKWICQYALGF
jgi:hypothetical protein